MKNIKFIAASAILLWAGGNFAHQKHSPVADNVVKEQKDWGIAGDAKAVQRTLRVTMSDQMRFSPNQFTVKVGDTVRLIIKNEGKLMHELVIGTPQELEAHAALMVRFPDMAHDEPYMAHVPPGQSGELVWTFNRPGEFKFACLIAGHYQAGMTGQIVVTPSP
jgi:uncharacterized cupredoxin-like copper-binding protein